MLRSSNHSRRGSISRQVVRASITTTARWKHTNWDTKDCMGHRWKSHQSPPMRSRTKSHVFKSTARRITPSPPRPFCPTARTSSWSAQKIASAGNAIDSWWKKHTAKRRINTRFWCDTSNRRNTLPPANRSLCATRWKATTRYSARTTITTTWTTIRMFMTTFPTTSSRWIKVSIQCCASTFPTDDFKLCCFHCRRAVRRFSWSRTLTLRFIQSDERVRSSNWCQSHWRRNEALHEETRHLLQFDRRARAPTRCFHAKSAFHSFDKSRHTRLHIGRQPFVGQNRRWIEHVAWIPFVGRLQWRQTIPTSADQIGSIWFAGRIRLASIRSRKYRKLPQSFGSRYSLAAYVLGDTCERSKRLRLVLVVRHQWRHRRGAIFAQRQT